MKKLNKSIQFVKEFAELAYSNPKVVEKVKRIIKNIAQDGLLNFNKGEKLKYYPNRYACRIDKKNRLIYEKYNDIIVLLSCRGHYDDEWFTKLKVIHQVS